MCLQGHILHKSNHMETGITYTKTGERSRGIVQLYHHKPNPLMLNKTKHRVDIAGLKRTEQRTAVKFDGQEYESAYTIGMEVEKNEFAARSVKEYELFCGFERDSSCGYEAVTHIIPLLPKGSWRNKVFDMMHKAEKIIDDRYSRSDERGGYGHYKCGGHITIGVKGMNGNEIREAMRKHCGIILSLFRKRLNNTFCGSNRRMQGKYDDGMNSFSRSYEYNEFEFHKKYQTALVKGDVLEFRLVSKFESVKQMMRRYELFYEVVNFAITNPNGTHESLMKVVKPIISSMYEGNEEKVNETIRLAKHFRKFILDNSISEDISKFLQ